eukprot:GDKJ01022024.1.p1 GENE.GDKJ01022024.1~~GDKJ01022024.1.p1  ORF type:complete len:236 (-),score=54.00 GDKJ01022024.1:30-737(-)
MFSLDTSSFLGSIKGLAKNLKNTIQTTLVNNESSFSVDDRNLPWKTIYDKIDRQFEDEFHRSEIENECRQRIKKIAREEKNFFSSVPENYKFDLSKKEQIAIRILAHEPTLESVKNKLVPEKMNDFDFWRVYFYMVDEVIKSFLSDIESGRWERQDEEKTLLSSPLSVPSKNNKIFADVIGSKTQLDDIDALFDEPIADFKKQPLSNRDSPNTNETLKKHDANLVNINFDDFFKD